MKELFQNKSFTLLFLSNLFSAFGTSMTMIGIPWAIVTKQDSDWFLGVVTIAPPILLLFLTPFFGMITDCYPKRSILVLTDGAGLISLLAIVFLFTLWGHSIWLFLFYTISLIIFYLKVPVIVGSIQQTLLPKLYITANSLIEISFQISHIAAGAVSIFLLNHLPIICVLLINSLSYALSWLFILKTKPVGTVESWTETITERQTLKSKALNDFLKAWQFLKIRPAMLVFFSCSQFPNVAVMVGAYLFPLYVARSLEAEGTVFAQGEIFYSIGALLAGILLQKIIQEGRNKQYLLATSGLVAISLLILTSMKSVLLFFIAYLFIGVGVAGSRISSVTLLMELIPRQLIGRVHSFFITLSTLLRIILISTFTMNEIFHQVTLNIMILGIISLIAWAGMFYCKIFMEISHDTFKENA